LNLAPLWFLLEVAGLATALTIATGLPVAWLLGRHRFPGHGLLEAGVVLPLVLPPTVLGYYMLVLIAHASPLGAMLAHAGINLGFTWQGAVVAAWLGAFGLFVRAAQSGFELVDGGLEDAARTLGRSEWSLFWSVTLPLAWRAVLGGTIVAFCRVIGDLAITLLVAGSLPAVNQNAPLAPLGQTLPGQLDLAGQFLLVTLGLVAAVLLLVGRVARAGGR
jgi:molybdate transport system permease protein